MPLTIADGKSEVDIPSYKQPNEQNYIQITKTKRKIMVQAVINIITEVGMDACAKVAAHSLIIGYLR